MWKLQSYYAMFIGASIFVNNSIKFKFLCILIVIFSSIFFRHVFKMAGDTEPAINVRVSCYLLQ